ncbi:Phe leader peptide [Aeromonas hydrophila subsp. hydrophila ATCC 7966]|uniref:Phe leader peptide n=1 Tax=Aeromonas hydrophila subsp. hydrophila (strain ATCC 7966 / DSM 30187 / BCRC 13018 / CCUG 14551 / JCM 1027 / KCTC 2358 / NCIMB 9240 / NCTC 8049) TaxID=380703 RepID=A0KH84_AERHH|nr:Phe leader peptide [Aeromonas hydrophila subsp. hydrophila ATCC 7966]
MHAPFFFAFSFIRPS